ncbi:hypothetical protein [Labrys okinawensis]|nr:hypothetical protein [Labrys okinawensis]
MTADMKAAAGNERRWERLSDLTTDFTSFRRINVCLFPASLPGATIPS